MKFIVILLLSINLSLAGEITLIKRGESAKYNGFLIDKAQMKDFRLINEKKKLSDARILVLSDLSVTRKGIIAYHKKRAERLNNALIWADTKLYATNVIFFALGVVATMVIVKNVPK